MSLELLKELKKAGITARYPELSDKEPLRLAYSGALSEAKRTKEWLQRLNEDDVTYVVESIMNFDEAFALVIEDQFLFAYRINDLWYRPTEKTLDEFTVLRLYPGGSNMSKVIKAMEVVAKHYDCVSINSGTSLASHDERVARYYKRSGFIQEGISLWKNME